MDPLILRGLERIIVAIGAIVFAYFGYRLYLSGVEKGRTHLSAESKFYKFALSGTGPGLFFMALGGVVLVSALFTGGGVKTKTTENFMPSIKSKAPTEMRQHTQAPPDANERPRPC